jgi:cell division protein ZapA (FtsZ GTPase activity inhibitor)
LKKPLELNVLGKTLVIKSDESEEYVREVEDFLHEKIAEVRENTKAVGNLDLALLVALNVAGELIKMREVLGDVEQSSATLVELIERRST